MADLAWRPLAGDLAFPEGPAFAPDGSLWCVEYKGGALVRLQGGRLERTQVGGSPTLGLFHFLATHPRVPAALQAEMQSWGLHREEFADNCNLPYQLYIREARRMKGATIVTQRDVNEDRRKPYSIGISSHFIDSHHVQRVAVSPEAFVNEGRIWRTSMAYQIPYRALTPQQKDCENLLVPGAASFSHVAFCSYRLESVWMIAGHAAGVAAALSAKARKPVQQIQIKALQDKLRAQRQVVDFVPGQPERWTDIHKDTGGPPVI